MTMIVLWGELLDDNACAIEVEGRIAGFEDNPVHIVCIAHVAGVFTRGGGVGIRQLWWGWFNEWRQRINIDC